MFLQQISYPAFKLLNVMVGFVHTWPKYGLKQPNVFFFLRVNSMTSYFSLEKTPYKT